MKSLFHNARFYLSAHQLSDLPPPNGTEIVFAGRSNAGKSSAINTLAQHKRLAYVSKQPGRTQLINFFDLGDQNYLVDLPGYGYAKVPAHMRQHWETLLSAYLTERPCLGGMVLIMDIRHPLTPLDQQMLNWFLPTQKPVHILLTKADKLSKSAALQTCHATRAALQRNWPHSSLQLFSSLKRQGIEEAIAHITPWLNQHTPPSSADEEAPPHHTL